MGTEGHTQRGQNEAAVFPPNEETQLRPFPGAVVGVFSGYLEIFVVK